MDNFITPKMFAGQHANFLDQVKKLDEPPLSRHAELTDRIRRGKEKIAAAQDKGVSEAKVGVALKKVHDLEKELEIVDVWVQRHRLYAHTAALVQLVQELNVDGVSAVEVIVPGLFDAAVRVDNTETPF